MKHEALVPAETPTDGQPSCLKRREGVRTHLSTEVQLRIFFSDGGLLEGEGTVIDLSKKGCKVDCPSEVELGTFLEIWLFLPKYDWPLRVERAQVKWREGEQFGVEFLTLRPGQRDRLRRYLQSQENPLRASRTLR
jgi:hypothetical protein